MDCVTDKLNILLSNLNVFYRKVQNYHWNVTGNDFFNVHLKLEEYYNEINEQIDEMAEHILMLNCRPLGTMKDYLEKTTIAEAKNEEISSCCIFDNLKSDFQKLLDEVKCIKKEADEKQFYSTSAMMDNYISIYEKHLWMLRQTCKTK